MRTAVVTGASGGIGAAVVVELAARGFRTLALGRDADRLAPLSHDAVTTIVFDLLGEQDAPAEALLLDRLDALVHCAGIAPVASVAETTRGDWDRVLTTNVIGPARLTAALLPSLRRARGAVAFIGMAPGVRDAARWSAYVGSKAALRELAGSLRAEESNLRVALVSPGGTATPLLREVRQAFGRPYHPETTMPASTVASAVVDLVTAPATAWRDEIEVLGSDRGDRPADHQQRS